MFHKEGFNIILSTFFAVAIIVISLDYFEVKNAFTIKATAKNVLKIILNPSL